MFVLLIQGFDCHFFHNLKSNVGKYLVHVPAAEVLHSGEGIAMFMLERRTDIIAVPVVAPISVMSNAVAAKDVAAEKF